VEMDVRCRDGFIRLAGDLMRRLWPDTFVEEGNVAKHAQDTNQHAANP
jgi:hypothetical protein